MTLRVAYRGAETWPHGGRQRIRDRAIDLVIIHRLGASLRGWPHELHTVADVAAAFAGLEELRPEGGEVYDLVVWRDGRVEQWHPLRQYGAHALGASRRSVGIACIGDFRVHAPTDEQWSALVQLCTVLRGGLQAQPAVLGHSDVAGGYRDQEKRPGGREECPGPLLDLAALAHVTTPRASYLLGDYGIIW